MERARPGLRLQLLLHQLRKNFNYTIATLPHPRRIMIRPDNSDPDFALFVIKFLSSAARGSVHHAAAFDD